jgi:hypothetical protein
MGATWGKARGGMAPFKDKNNTSYNVLCQTISSTFYVVFTCCHAQRLTHHDM